MRFTALSPTVVLHHPVMEGSAAIKRRRKHQLEVSVIEKERALRENKAIANKIIDQGAARWMQLFSLSVGRSVCQLNFLGQFV